MSAKQIKTGARDPAPLARHDRRPPFRRLQLNDLDALGPRVRAAHRENTIALDHSDDNGAFLHAALGSGLDRAVPLQLAPADKGTAQRRPRCERSTT